MKEGLPSRMVPASSACEIRPSQRGKSFVNWLLSKEGRNLRQSMHQATRRLDVDTKWLKQFGALRRKMYYRATIP